MEPDKVLVLGDDSRAFLAVVRSLGRRGLAVHVCPFDHAAFALRSRHIAAIHRLPPYNLDPAAWVEAVRTLFDQHRFALVVPCDDRSILPLQRHREAWGGTRIALPNEAAFAAFFDKQATRELAALDRPELYLVEGFFEGSGVGVSILAAEGEILQAFQHHRVFESGPTGGSTYRVSAALDPALEQATAALARAAALHGVAMFEFRRNMATGQFVLLEVNARFWGSLPLAIAAGIDFPAQLYDLLVEGRRHPRIRYRVGQYARSLGNDAYRVVGALSDHATSLPARLARVGGEFATGLGRMLLGRERHDTFAGDDLRPWLGEWGEIGTWIAGGATRRVPLMPRLAAARHRRALAAQLRPIEGRVRRLLVLCFGNICRSPFAAALLAERLRETRPDILVTQAGFLPKEGRPSPPTAIEEAAGFGIDLSAHRSRFAHDAEVVAADAILVFDGHNLAELARRGLPADARVVMLGDFAAQPGDIEDPYGGPAATFHETYGRIAACIDAVVDTLRR